MRIFKLLHQESGKYLYLFALFGLLSGILHAAILPFINYIMNIYMSSEFQVVNYAHIAFYFTLVVIMIVAQRTFSRYMTSLTQNLILRIRISLLNTIRKANYFHYEQIGQEEIYTAITRDATIVSNSAASIVYASTSLITVIACLSYLAYLSWIGFVATILTVTVGVFFYLIRQKKVDQIFRESRASETTFFKHIKELLGGFKEVKVNQAKNDDIFDNHIEKTSQKTSGLMLRGINYYLDNSLVGQMSFLSLIAFILFGFPLLGIPVSSILSYVFVILYIMGPIEGVMNSIPGITQANISLLSIEKIKDQAEQIVEDYQTLSVRHDFNKLAFKSVEFSYDQGTDAAFHVGPIDLEIRQGEMTFIVGGNGSGKTTFFKLLTGLYQAQKGQILVDDKPMPIGDYRNLFSPIYSDFYLFDSLYGMSQEISTEEVDNLLAQFQLQEKVTYSDKQFSTTSLSTGQRKRLALIIALLEEKQILVLDEWAADQDPQFRRFFYEEILPELKRKSCTIIAITHDDKYFHLADKVYKMEDGIMQNFVREQEKSNPIN